MKIIDRIRHGMGVKQKIIFTALIAALLPVIVISVLIGVQSSQATAKVSDELDVLTQEDIAHISQDVYSICETADALVQQQVDADLNVARYVLHDTGAVNESSETVSWNAVDQLTGTSTTIALPKMTVGGTWLGQNKSTSVSSPVVDSVKELVGGTCTIFQRMNSNGDMLRVATNVLKADNTRAIGTYIPAVAADGTKNAVVSTVLKGETYHGRAFVVDSWYITAYEPIKSSDGKIIGMLYVGVKQEAVTALRNAIMNIKVGKTGYVYVLGGTGDTKGHYIISKGGTRDGEDIWEAKDADGNLFIQSIVNKALPLKEGEVAFQTYPWKNEGESQARMKIAAITYFKPWDWVIGAGAYEDDFMAARTQASSALSNLLKWTLIGGAIVLCLSVLLSFLISRQIANPLLKLVPIAQAVARGDVNQKVTVKSNDEVGTVAEAFGEVVGYMQTMAQAAEKIADGDLTVEVTPKSEKDALGNAFSKMVASLAQLIGQFKASANTLADASKQLSSAAEQAGHATQGIASTSQQVAKGAGDQAQNVQSTTVSVEQLSKAIDQIAQGAQEQAKGTHQAANIVNKVSTASAQVASSSQAAAEGSKEAAAAAGNGAEMVNKTVEGMQKIMAAMGVASKKVTDLGERSNEIGKIVATIDDIAAQTNLLALNAAIEAARAGEQGRGFAVVADEVRKLAERSSMATKEIADLITGIQKGVSEAVKAMEEGDKQVEAGNKLAADAGQSLKSIHKVATDVSSRIEQISAAAKELSALANEMVKTIDSVSSIVEENTGATEQMAANSSEVTKALENVAGISEQNSAATQEISASAEEMSAQVEQVVASAQSLSDMAKQLLESVGLFRLNGHGAKEKVASK